MLPIINLRLPSCQPNTPGPCRERFEENAELWQSTRDRAERIRVSVLRSRLLVDVPIKQALVNLRLRLRTVPHAAVEVIPPRRWCGNNAFRRRPHWMNAVCE